MRWLTTIFGPRDAEDIAQEAFARLYARPGLLDGDPWPWLAVVARNVGRDLARHNAFTTPVDSGTLDLLPGDHGVPDAVLRRDDAARVVAALRHLCPRDRALLCLRDVDGVSVGDIAAQLGINDNAVRQQLHRARRRLATAYVGLARRHRRRPGDRPPGHAGPVRP